MCISPALVSRYCVLIIANNKGETHFWIVQIKRYILSLFEV